MLSDFLIWAFNLGTTAFVLPFDMDDSSFDVDLVATEGQANNFHIPNLPGEDFRRIFAQTTNERSPLYMRIRLDELHHGTMVHDDENCQATLLLFEFRFLSRLQDHRYQSAKITFEFLDKEGESHRDPAVVALAPDRMHWLNKTTYARTTGYRASASATAGVGVAGGKLGVHWDVEQTEQKRFKATLTGSPGRTRGKMGDENAVTWTMEENKNGSKEGIPSFLQAAVLLKRRHGRPFIARLSVKNEVNLAALGHRALPITTDKDKVIDLVTFRPGTKQGGNPTCSRITAKDLEHMERLQLNKYFAVNLSEEDPLTPLRASSTAPRTAAPERTADGTPAPPPLTPASAPVAVALAASPSTPAPELETISPPPLLGAEPPATPITEPAVAAVAAAAEAAAAAARAAGAAARAAAAVAEAAGKAAQAAGEAAQASALAAEAAARLALRG